MGSTYTAAGTGLPHYEMKTGREKARVEAGNQQVALEPSTLSLYHAPGHRKLLEWQRIVPPRLHQGSTFRGVFGSVGQIRLGLPKSSAAQGFTFGQGSTFVSHMAVGGSRQLFFTFVFQSCSGVKVA